MWHYNIVHENANIIQTSEIVKVHFDISQRVQYIFAVYCKYNTNERDNQSNTKEIFNKICTIFRCKLFFFKRVMEFI